MNPGIAFSITSAAAACGWLILLAGIALKRPFLRDMIAGRAVPAMLSASYAVIVVLFWQSAEGGFDSLAGVQQLFTSPWAALAGWIHFLAFDLAIGAWTARQVMEKGLNRLLLVPVLPVIFLFGPIGYLIGQLILLTPQDVRS